jgi:hypothetical protein
VVLAGRGVVVLLANGQEEQERSITDLENRPEPDRLASERDWRRRGAFGAPDPVGHIEAASGQGTIRSQRTTPATTDRHQPSSPGRSRLALQVDATLFGSLTRNRPEVQLLPRPPIRPAYEASPPSPGKGSWRWGCGRSAACRCRRGWWRRPCRTRARHRQAVERCSPLNRHAGVKGRVAGPPGASGGPVTMAAGVTGAGAVAARRRLRPSRWGRRPAPLPALGRGARRRRGGR